jgi:hypothetical protein
MANCRYLNESRVGGACKTDRCDVANIRYRASENEVQYNRIESPTDYSVDLAASLQWPLLL